MSEHNNSLYENSEYPSRRRAPEEEPRPRRRRKKRRRIGWTIFKVLGTLMLVGLCTGALLCCFAAVYISTVLVPEAELSIDDFQLGENSVMYYVDKETGAPVEMVTLLNTISSVWVDYEDMPKDLIDAAVAIEDKRFWEHPGVDWRRTLNAVKDMFMGNDISGGSTITQQLIKNLTDYDETTVKRKLIEIVRALRLTQNSSKEDVLTYYLNIIPLGSGCEGVGSAAYKYFGKDVSQLTLAECASLISITNNPSKYSPYSTARVATESTGELWTARQWNKWRQENVLNEMLKQEMISQEEYDQAVAQELVFVRGENDNEEATIYSWYEETVIADVKEDLKNELGWSEARISQALANGGLRIYSCMDPEIQAIAEKIYTNRDNLNYTSADGQLMQSSITIIDNATGDVAAIVGQFGQKTGNLWTNYANTAKRQPGSSIKPLTVYSPAVEMGLISPITVVDDYPYNDSKPEGWPSNSGTSKYKGLTSVRTALKNSVNTIAVRILADMVTPQESFRFMEERYHIDLVDAMEVGNQIKSDIDVAPLSMGGLTSGVSTRDMAEAYATFPNNGVYTYSRTYTKVTQLVDGQEVLLLEKAPKQETVLKESTAYYMNSMLSDVITSGTAAGHGIGITAAGKTGTTSENYDRWFVGYTPYYTAAVWTGYPVNAKMKGDNRSLELWEKVMEEIHAGLDNKSFATPDGLKTVSYCQDSGLLATDYCTLDPRGSRVVEAKVFEEDIPDGLYCTCHTEESLVKLCKGAPVLDEKEAETGMYHLAGAFCPEEEMWEVCLPKYEREPIGTAVALDEMYRYATVTMREACTVHTEPEVVEPDPFDPFFPWFPTEDEDPEDWGSEEDLEGSQDIGLNWLPW